MAVHELIDVAFRENVDLAKRVHKAIRERPDDAPLYLEIAKYVRQLQSNTTTSETRASNFSAVPPKRRKLENGTGSQVPRESLPDQEARVILEARDLSFSIPMRKKLHLELVQAISPTSGCVESVYQARARHPASGELVYKVDMQSFSTHIRSILPPERSANIPSPEHALLLPVPEKAQKQHNFVLLPEAGLGIGHSSAANEDGPTEPLLWTVSDGVQSVTTFSDEHPWTAMQREDGVHSEQILNTYLEKSLATRIVQPDDSEFASAIPEAHRKGANAYHVKAFRGSKDGYLFFLATGIFFGFKKPLAYFPLETINSISYTSVLQRTFDLNIAVQLPDQETLQEHEFSMIDQAEFAGIDIYIKRHGLQDASLAEGRKAKKLNLNGPKKAGDKGVADEGERQGELQKAQQDIEDAEDEEEEDYDPGSEGLSDGSGESSEGAEFQEGRATVDEGDDVDLVAEELGSEAEEVVPATDDEEQL